ncbi:MAG TPA: CoA transferase [Trebonia sp.]|nr:CoA transferase [Trebonia sp.]
MPDEDAPLSGLRILEVSSFVAAPLGGMTLAQLGAEVIRVDPIGGAADVTRWPLAPSGASLYWTGLNKGKRSVTLDFRSAEGRQAFRDLVANSGPDGGIVLTNAAFPWLSYEELRKDRPDLIHLQITGRHDGGHAVDYTVNAAIGFPLVTGGESGANPVNHVLPAWDVACGLYAAVGLLAAERHRRSTGQGRSITLPLADVALAVTGHLGLLAEAQVTGTGRPRIGNHLYGSFARDFRTAAGDSVMIVTLTARHFQDLARATGLTETLSGLEKLLGADFGKDGDRYEHREVIAALLAPWFARHTAGEIKDALAGTTVLWDRYRTFAEVAADPDLLANPLVRLIDQPGAAQVLATGIPLAQPGTGDIVPAPVLGADTAAVLAELLGDHGGQDGREIVPRLRRRALKNRLRGRDPRHVQVDHVQGDPGQPRRQAAPAAHHGDPYAARHETRRGLAEHAVTRPDRHMREPPGDVLVQQHVEQFQVRAVRAGPDPVPGVRPAERGVQQAEVARRHHHLIVAAEARARHVAPLDLADLAESRDGGAGEVLDVDDVERALGKSSPDDRRPSQLPDPARRSRSRRWHPQPPPPRPWLFRYPGSPCVNRMGSMHQGHGSWVQCTL